MSTTLRGYGSYKNDFVSSLRDSFGTTPFIYREASKLPGFEHRIFHKLIYDRLLAPVRNEKEMGVNQPKSWKLIDARETRIGRKSSGLSLMEGKNHG